MTYRYLITYTDSDNELQAEFADRIKLGVGADALPEVVVAAYMNPRTRYFYKYFDFPPEYEYHATERANVDADYMVYRETAEGDLVWAGAVRCEMVAPPIGNAQEGVDWEAHDRLKERQGEPAPTHSVEKPDSHEP